MKTWNHNGPLSDNSHDLALVTILVGFDFHTPRGSNLHDFLRRSSINVSTVTTTTAPVVLITGVVVSVSPQGELME